MDISTHTFESAITSISTYLDLSFEPSVFFQFSYTSQIYFITAKKSKYADRLLEITFSKAPDFTSRFTCWATKDGFDSSGFEFRTFFEYTGSYFEYIAWIKQFKRSFILAVPDKFNDYYLDTLTKNHTKKYENELSR
ncbi:MAG: hypothetical protein ACRCZG_05140 [Culicoidibacterales bacterium]